MHPITFTNLKWQAEINREITYFGELYMPPLLSWLIRAISGFNTVILGELK